VAQRELVYYGFFTLSMMGAIYHIVPRIMCGPLCPASSAPNEEEGAEFCPKLRAASFWLVLIGALTSYLALVAGGVGQGILLSDARNSFMDVLRATLMPVRISTLGDLLLFVGAFLFLLNFVKVIVESGQRWKTEFVPSREPGRRS
jgi:cbb3-type cytochrome oxidase subunit 1